jgi:hypothetical protein
LKAISSRESWIGSTDIVLLHEVIKRIPDYGGNALGKSSHLRCICAASDRGLFWMRFSPGEAGHGGMG